MKQELVEKFPIEPPRSSKDGVYQKDFFLNFHVLLYKYRKYGRDIMSENNFNWRIKLLQEAEEMMKNNQTNDPEIKEQEGDVRKKYMAYIKEENIDADAYTQKLQELIFDYFNMIKKEYYMALDKYATDPDYVKEIKEEHEKVDKEMYDEEMSLPIPETLTKEIAN